MLFITVLSCAIPSVLGWPSQAWAFVSFCCRLHQFNEKIPTSASSSDLQGDQKAHSRILLLPGGLEAAAAAAAFSSFHFALSAVGISKSCRFFYSSTLVFLFLSLSICLGRRQSKICQQQPHPHPPNPPPFHRPRARQQRLGTLAEFIFRAAKTTPFPSFSITTAGGPYAHCLRRLRFGSPARAGASLLRLKVSHRDLTA